MINYAFYIIADKRLLLHVNLYYPLVIEACKNIRCNNIVSILKRRE